jgi:hypothetical protein
LRSIVPCVAAARLPICSAAVPVCWIATRVSASAASIAGPLRARIAVDCSTFFRIAAKLA